jgi:Raf kinase inhibitor-like YbhB/YbcL family protein
MKRLLPLAFVAVAPLAHGGVAMQLTSSAFPHEGEIPAAFTCEGADRAPPLAWTGAPPTVKSFALVVDDPDAPDPKAPRMTWVHWIAYNLPGSTHTIPEGGKLPPGALDGVSDFKRTGWGGPCPPVGRHRYFFKLYALDTTLPDLKHPTKAQLEQAMQGHVLAKAELIGTYQKKK